MTRDYSQIIGGVQTLIDTIESFRQDIEKHAAAFKKASKTLANYIDTKSVSNIVFEDRQEIKYLNKELKDMFDYLTEYDPDENELCCGILNYANDLNHYKKLLSDCLERIREETFQHTMFDSEKTTVVDSLKKRIEDIRSRNCNITVLRYKIKRELDIIKNRLYEIDGNDNRSDIRELVSTIDDSREIMMEKIGCVETAVDNFVHRSI